jgi:NuA3 HAT complex component NTO1
VSTFSADLANVFTTEIGVQPAGDTAELQMQISGRAPELSLEQREKRKLAKRIIKAIQPALEDAIRKESELSGKPFEKELKELDLILESGVLSRRASLVEGPADQEVVDRNGLTNGAIEDSGTSGAGITQLQSSNESPAEPAAHKTEDIDMHDASQTGKISSGQVNGGAEPVLIAVESLASDSGIAKPIPGESNSADDSASGIARKDNDTVSSHPPGHLIAAAAAPLTPPLSFQGDSQLPLAQGGIQWYMQPFDPIGTTVHEERWTGRDVMRGMSEELSELDEDELKGLMDHELEEGFGDLQNGTTEVADGSASEAQAVKVHRTRRRWRGFK